MSKMVQIRNVPDKLHTILKVRAAKAGMSLSDYLLRELAKAAAAPTNEEMIERLRKLPPVQTDVSSADLIRDARDSRDDRERQIDEWLMTSR